MIKRKKDMSTLSTDKGIYDVGQIVDKTLFARTSIPVYDFAPGYGTVKQLGTISPGQKVGKVYSYIDADISKGRYNLWWMFYPASTNGQYYFAEMLPGAFDLDALKAQGALTDKEIADKKNEANKEWYEKLADKILPAITGIVIGAVVINAVAKSGTALLSSGKKKE